MSGQDFLFHCTTVTLALLSLSLILALYRIVRGPTLPDRIMGLDLLIALVIGYIAVIAIRTGYMLYVDIAIALGLVGFLSTIAFARFVLQRWHIATALDAAKNSEDNL